MWFLKLKVFLRKSKNLLGGDDMNNDYIVCDYCGAKCNIHDVYYKDDCFSIVKSNTDCS